MAVKPLWTSAAGVNYRFDDSAQADGFYRVIKSQDVAPILDRNKAMANENNGWSTDKDKAFRRVGSIPLILIQKWLEEEGWDAFAPENADKLKAKLNSSDFQHLRTAHWRL